MRGHYRSVAGGHYPGPCSDTVLATVPPLEGSLYQLARQCFALCIVTQTMHEGRPRGTEGSICFSRKNAAISIAETSYAPLRYELMCRTGGCQPGEPQTFFAFLRQAGRRMLISTCISMIDCRRQPQVVRLHQTNIGCNLRDEGCRFACRFA